MTLLWATTLMKTCFLFLFKGYKLKADPFFFFLKAIVFRGILDLVILLNEYLQLYLKVTDKQCSD